MTDTPVVLPILPAVPVPGATPFLQLLGQSEAGRCEGDS